MKTFDNISDIKTTVAQFFGISVDDMASPRRPSHIAWPRQIAMALARERTPLSLEAIGASFGNRDHGTVIHAAKRVSDRCKIYQNDRLILTTLRVRLTSIKANRDPFANPIPDA